MKEGWKWFFGIVAFIVAVMLLSLSFGWFGVFQTKTVGKAQQNADRAVFEETQSYVEGKRQALTRYHSQWAAASADDKITIEATVRMEFASFSEEKYLKDDYPILYNFLRDIKNK
jgi:hypothetical protein